MGRKRTRSQRRDDERLLKAAQDAIDKWQSRINESKSLITVITDTLKTEFGITTMRAAEHKLAKMQKEHTNKVKERSALLDKVEEILEELEDAG